MAMSLSLAVTAGASYNTFDDQDKIENQEAVFLLNALDIVEGRETGDFDPAANINRAEAAKLVAALNLAGVPVPNAKGVSSFSDVLGDGSVAWANNYIEYGVSQGSINGMGDGTFAPKANVTGVQFAKMLLGILGYDAAEEGYTGTNWMYNVNIDAVDAGLYRGLDIDATAALSRDDAAQMMYNALKAKTVIYLTDTTGALKLTDKNLMETIYPTVSYDFGVITYIEYNVDKAEYTYNVSVDGKTVKLKTDVDYTDMLHMNVMFVEDVVEGVLGVYAFENTVATGLVGDLVIADLVEDKLVDNDTSFVKLTTSHNGDINATAFETLNRDNLGHDYFEYKAIDNDDDAAYDMIFVYEKNFETVSFKNSDYFMFKNVSVKFDTEENTFPAGLAKDDKVVSSYDTTLKTWIVVEKLAANTGVVNTVRANNGTITEIVIGGASYDYCADKCLSVAGALHNWPGLTVEFYVINGYVVSMEKDISLSRDYLLITAIDGDYNADGYSVDATVLFGNNTTDVITIASLDGKKGEAIRNEVLPFLEQTVGVNGQIGYLVRYEVVDGKYELTSTGELDRMVAAKEADLGFDKTAAAYNTDKPAYHSATTNAEYGYITVGSDVVRIAEDALVFLVDQDGTEYAYSAVSGADIANMTGATTVNYVGYEKAADGFYYATLIYVQTDLEYMSATITGIIVSEPKFEANEDDDFVYFELYDGEQTYTVYADLHGQYEPVLSNLKAGHVIDYRVDDGMLQMVRFVEGAKAAITAYSPSTAYADLILDGAFAANLADDVKVFFMDTAEDVVVTGEIAEAAQDENGNYIDNVYVVFEGNEIVLMIVDPVQEYGIQIETENLK